MAVMLKWLLGDVEGNKLDELQLLQWSERHRILLYPFIHAQEKKYFSSQFLQHCRYKYFQNHQRIQKVENFFKKLNEFLKVQSIYATVLKGVFISENYYTDKFVRHSRDVDILVDEQYILLLTDWLRGEGFQLESDYFSYHLKQKEIFWRNNHHFCFYGDNDAYPSIVELHWKLRSNDDVCNIEPFRGDFLSLKTSYSHLFVFNHLDQFIYLCVHGTEHAWYRMKWLLDLVFLTNRVKLNWKQVSNRARQLNALEYVEISLYLMHYLTEKNVVDDFRIDLCSYSIKRRSVHIWKRMSQSSYIENGYVAAVRQIFFLSSFNERKYNWNFWMKWWISPADWKKFPLPNCFFFLYYPLRPFFWIIRKSFK